MVDRSPTYSVRLKAPFTATFFRGLIRQKVTYAAGLHRVPEEMPEKIARQAIAAGATKVSTKRRAAENKLAEPGDEDKSVA